MADKITLSEGALRLIMRGGNIEDPIMQVLGSKRIASGPTGRERFRLLLSDGKYAISFAVLTTQTHRELAANTIIKIKRYITSVINDAAKGNKQRVLVILEMDTLVPGEKTSKIGNPEHLPEGNMQQDVPVRNGTTSTNGHNGHLFIYLFIALIVQQYTYLQDNIIN